jgi:hypothetical protein
MYTFSFDVETPSRAGLGCTYGQLVALTATRQLSTGAVSGTQTGLTVPVKHANIAKLTGSAATAPIVERDQG